MGIRNNHAVLKAVSKMAANCFRPRRVACHAFGMPSG